MHLHPKIDYEWPKGTHKYARWPSRARGNTVRRLRRTLQESQNRFLLTMQPICSAFLIRSKVHHLSWQLDRQKSSAQRPHLMLGTRKEPPQHLGVVSMDGRGQGHHLGQQLLQCSPRQRQGLLMQHRPSYPQQLMLPGLTPGMTRLQQQQQ
jgi:hypothetical protein